MLRQMERSAIVVMAKRGKSIRQIASELGRSPTTISRVLHEPVDRAPAKRHRSSQVDPYREQIAQWLEEELPVVRMLEMARDDPDRPYTGSRSQFGEIVRRIRCDRDRERAAEAVPIRFEGLAGEYLQVDWGEIRRFPFTQQDRTTRYFLCCRLKYSRWSFLRWTTDTRQETLFRGLVACFSVLGFVPWVLIFDNMKTVTSGRDVTNQPLWTPALLQLAAEFGFHPQACDPGAGNQKGSVESLVKWVKGNFLPGRSFTDDDDLAQQAAAWTQMAHERPCSATGVPPSDRLDEERRAGGRLPVTAADYGLLLPGQVAADATVAVLGNRYSVPVAHVRALVTVRLHASRIRIWRDALLLADHERAPDGSRMRIIDPTHFAPLFDRKPRAQAMLYREVLLTLPEPAPSFLAALSHRQRDRLVPELLAVFTLYEQHGVERLLAAMKQALLAGTAQAAALALLLAPIPDPAALIPLPLPGLPTQAEVDRSLASYETWVLVDEAQEVPA